MVTNGLSLLLQRVVITGNDSGIFSGGGLSNSAIVTLESCTVTNNRASVGGGLGNDFDCAAMTLKDTTVLNNIATEKGGGINNQGDLIISGQSSVKNNESQGGAGTGGGIFNTKKVTITNGAVVKDNKPDQRVNDSGGTGC